MTALMALLVFTIRQTAFDRKIVLTLLLLAGPSGLFLLVRILAPEWQDDYIWRRYHSMLMHVLLGGVVPLACMVHGPALIGAEADSGTLVYLLTRRMRRSTVLLVRFAATALVLVAAVEIAVVACHFSAVGGLEAEVIVPAWGDRTPLRDMGDYLLVALIATPAFLAVFTTISLITVRSLVASGLYVFVVEVMIANIPAGARAYSINHHVRKTLAYLNPRSREIIRDWQDVELMELLYPQGSTGLMTLIAVIAALLIVSSILVTRRELTPTKVTRE